MASPVDLLRQACAANLSTSSSLSDDGKTLTLLGSSFDATVPHKITVSDSKGGTKEVSYTLASIYLQLLNASVLQYRKACEAGDVRDPVKILDKGLILAFFRGAGGEDGGAAEPAAEDGKKADDAMDMSDDDDAAAAADDSKRESVQFTHPDEKRARREPDEKRARREKDKDHHRGGRGESRGGRDRDRSGVDRHHRDREHRSHSKSRKKEEDKEDRRKSGGKGAKGAMVPITNEQLVANLSTIVDKRDKVKVGTPSKEKSPAKENKDGKEDKEDEGAAFVAKDDTTTPTDSRQTTAATPALTDDEGGPSKEDAEKKEKEGRELLFSWLSPAGFQVNSPAVAAAIEADRDAVRRITALEIPVGDSASILRAGAGGEIVEKGGGDAASTPGGAGSSGVKKRDFARVLEIYQEVAVAEEKAKRSANKKRPPPPPSSKHRGKGARTSSSSSGGGKSSSKSSAAPKGNPIIVVPNAMTSAITMINAGFFLGKDAVFVPRAQAMKDPTAGKRGGTITITRRLNQRLGGAEVTYDVIDNPTTRLKRDEWDRVVAVICQGASWQFKGWRYSDPVDLFSRTFGFYVGLEGATVPNELRGWNVKIGKVSRDRRGLDNVCLASFWNGLEEFMAVHKQELFKS